MKRFIIDGRYVDLKRPDRAAARRFLRAFTLWTGMSISEYKK